VFIDQPAISIRDGIYGTQGQDFAETRSASRSSPTQAAMGGADRARYDVIHAHDWQAGPHADDPVDVLAGRRRR
jgi:glycogen synthase